MPRDTTDFEYPRDAETTAARMAGALDTVSACYLCGAWADDAKRCRHPGSTSCIQASVRPAMLLRPAVGAPWSMPAENVIRH